MTRQEELKIAKKLKADEFYTQYEDIKKEIYPYFENDNDIFKNKVIFCPCDDYEKSNFTKFFMDNYNTFGIKKIICTSFEGVNSSKGKYFIYEKEHMESGFLKGDGDFRTDEVTKFRNEADVVVTNPPFSLFKEFITWLFEANKRFIILGNVNAISYKETFLHIKNNELWLGHSIHSGDREFAVPNDYPLNASTYRTNADGQNFIRVKGVRWFTNIDHAKFPPQLKLMSMKDNLTYNTSLIKKLNKDYGTNQYPYYDNYKALEIPLSNAIPSDYDDVMGVPITFLDKYNPKQFCIVGWSRHNDLNMDGGYWEEGTCNDAMINKKAVYRRILIKKINPFIY